jgi:hypothetical protein
VFDLLHRSKSYLERLGFSFQYYCHAAKDDLDTISRNKNESASAEKIKANIIYYSDLA